MAYTALELVNACLRRAGNRPQIATLANPTDDARFIARMIDLEQKRVCAMAHWEWTRAEAPIHLVPQLEGTCTTVSNGFTSLSVTNPSTTPIADLRYDVAANPTSPYVGAWCHFPVASPGQIYKMHTIDDGAGSLVFPAFYGAVGANKAVVIAQDGYVLPSDFDKPLTADSYVTAPWKMRAVDPEEFMYARSYNERRNVFFTKGKPEIYTMWRRTVDSTFAELMVDPFPEHGESITLHYYKSPGSITFDTAGNSVDIVVPAKWQDYLINVGLRAFHTFWDIDLTKAAMYDMMAKQTLAQMLLTVERTSERSFFAPQDQPQFYGAK